MLTYIVKRSILLLPTVFCVAMVTFFLSTCTNEDLVERLHSSETIPTAQKNNNLNILEQNYKQAAEKLGIDKPLFYFGFPRYSKPEKLHDIFPLRRRTAAMQLLNQTGDWAPIESWYSHLYQFNELHLQQPDTNSSLQNFIITKSLQLNNAPSSESITSIIEELERKEVDIGMLKKANAKLSTQTNLWRNFIPTFNWHGMDNQFHHWTKGFFKGDWGVSLYDRLPVFDKVVEASKWTFVLMFLAIFFGLLISLFIGIYSISNKKGSKLISTLLLLYYSFPEFLVGTLLIIFFTTSEYGMKLFPSIGVGDINSHESFLSQLPGAFPHLILPITVITLGMVAYLSRHFSASLRSEMNKPYIRTAKSKGIPMSTIIRKHAFKNALFPMVTLIAVLLPLLISGSIVIEEIFNLPGTGRLIYQSILSSDWNVVFPLVMLGTILNILGYLLADVIFYFINPKVKFD